MNDRHRHGKFWPTNFFALMFQFLFFMSFLDTTAYLLLIGFFVGIGITAFRKSYTHNLLLTNHTTTAKNTTHMTLPKCDSVSNTQSLDRNRQIELANGHGYINYLPTLKLIKIKELDPNAIKLWASTYGILNFIPMLQYN